MLHRIADALKAAQIRWEVVGGLAVLIHIEEAAPENAVHLIFSGEKVRPEYVLPAPPIQPERKPYRDRDRVYIRSMDAAGLITSQIENLNPEFAARLQHIRETE